MLNVTSKRKEAKNRDLRVVMVSRGRAKAGAVPCGGRAPGSQGYPLIALMIIVKMTAAKSTPMMSTAKGDRLDIIVVVLLAI